MAAPMVQVIDGEGEFHGDAMKRFVAANGVADSRANYQVVAIMGPQSSGKSTLMNHLFGTSFVEMDAMTGRHQTTHGVWVAKSPKIPDITTLVMDLEGSDGRERGEDDTNFERQAALFALAVADVLLVNIWCHDIGREQGSGKPLMKTIFQVNLKLFAPEPNRRKTVLLFVIRDKSKTPLSKLSETLSEDIDKMWDSISKPAQYVGSSINDFFEVQFAALPHFEERHDDFVADTIVLRRRFSPPEDGEDVGDSLVRRNPERLPADSLPMSTADIWSTIRHQKDLNLPAHKIMVANVRCEDIKNEQLAAFTADQAWASLVADAEAGLVRDFGVRAAGLKDSCLGGYDQEAMYFHPAVREAKRVELAEGLADALAGPFHAQMRHLLDRELADFDKSFRLGVAEGRGGFSECARACEEEATSHFKGSLQDVLVPGLPELDGANAHAELVNRIAAYVDKAKHARVKDAVAAGEKHLTALLTPTTIDLLQHCPPNLWPKLHAACASSEEEAQGMLAQQLEGVDLSPSEAREARVKLQATGKAKLASLLQEAALTRVSRMRDAFNASFTLDENKTPRTWMPRDNIDTLARTARRVAATTLAALAVVRGPDYAGGDAVERAVLALAAPDIDAGPTGSTFDSGDAATSTAAGGKEGSGAAYDIHTAAQWPMGVAKEDVLITPAEARSAWKEFVNASGLAVQQAKITQQANLAAGKRAPPVWALMMILFLGWNEFVAVVWNPIYLVLGLVGFVFGYMLYAELDVDARMQQGWITGLLSIWSGFGDALRSVSERAISTGAALVGEGRQLLDERVQSGSREDRPSPVRGGGSSQHVSSAGLVRRKIENEGLQLAAMGGSGSSGFPSAKDE